MMKRIELLAKQFLYNKESRVFTADASEIGLPVGSVPFFISVVGVKDTVMYRLYETMNENEGWIYHPDMSTVPGASGTRLVIFND